MCRRDDANGPAFPIFPADDPLSILSAHASTADQFLGSFLHDRPGVADEFEQAPVSVADFGRWFGAAICLWQRSFCSRNQAWRSSMRRARCLRQLVGCVDAGSDVRFWRGFSRALFRLQSIADDHLLLGIHVDFLLLRNHAAGRRPLRGRHAKDARHLWGRDPFRGGKYLCRPDRSAARHPALYQ